MKSLTDSIERSTLPVDPRISARLADLGKGVVLQGSPAEFGRLIAAEARKPGVLIKAAGIKPV